MRASRRHGLDAGETIQVVMDDATAERLRAGAEERGLEVEQLIVHVLHVASSDLDRLLPLNP